MQRRAARAAATAFARAFAAKLAATDQRAGMCLSIPSPRTIVIAASASDEVSTEFEHAAVVFTEATRQHTAITEIQSLARDLVVTEATRRDVMHAVRERTQACEDALTNATLHLFGLVKA